MSFGSSFMTVFMNPWHSKYCAANNGSRESARKKTAQPNDRTALAMKAAVRQPVPPKTYPPSADLDRMKQHKILCRGRKTNDVSQIRQDSPMHRLRLKIGIKVNGLRRNAPCNGGSF